MKAVFEAWRQGSTIPLNVYEGVRPVCQCHNETDSKKISECINSLEALVRRLDEVDPFLSNFFEWLRSHGANHTWDYKRELDRARRALEIEFGK